MSLPVIGMNQTLTVQLDAAPATNQLPCSVSWQDEGAATTNFGGNQVLTTGLTPVVIVPAPANSISRQVLSLRVPNVDTAQHTVTVNLAVVGGQGGQQIKVILLPNYQLMYDGTFYVLDPSGNFCETTTSISGTVAVSNFPALQAVNVTELAGATLGAPSLYGTSPGAVEVPGANVFVTNTPPVNLAQVDGVVLGSPTAYGTAPTGEVIGANVYTTNPGSLGAAQCGTASGLGTTVSVIATSQQTYIYGIQITLMAVTTSAVDTISLCNAAGTAAIQWVLPTLASSTSIIFVSLQGMRLNFPTGIGVKLNSAPTAGSIIASIIYDFT